MKILEIFTAVLCVVLFLVLLFYDETNEIIDNIENIDNKEIIIKTIEKRPLTNKMKLYSEFIKKKNNKVPKSVANIIAYEVIKQSNELPSELILSIMMWVESKFDPLATNKSGAKGLMQVLNGGPNMDIDWDSIYNIDYNIKIGIKILKEHLRLNDNDINEALIGYVGGNKNYINKINKVQNELLIFISKKDGQNE